MSSRTTFRRGTAIAPLALATAILVSGCASGDFSSTLPPTTTGTPTPAATNPPSLPPLSTATKVNDYVGTQMPGPVKIAPQNLVGLHLDATALIYASSTLAFPQAPPATLPDSNGVLTPWANFWNLGDNTGANGLPGLQEYGLTVEVPSRLAFSVASGGSQITAMVPKQTSNCITPKSAAPYFFITLFGPGFVDATDAAYGTFTLSVNETDFQFSAVNQFTHAQSLADTGMINFGDGTCQQSSSAPDLGYFIDTPAATTIGNSGIHSNSAEENNEVRAFLGPTGLIVGNQQDAASDPLPGFIGMVEPSSPLDSSKLTASGVLYRAIGFEAGGDGTEWGYAAHSADGTFIQSANAYEALHSSVPDLLELAASSSPSSISFGAQYPNVSLSLGAQDKANPGLFPSALFISDQGVGSCPAGTALYSVIQQENFCSSPVVVMAGQHDGKYVMLITGFNQFTNAPTYFVLTQN